MARSTLHLVVVASGLAMAAGAAEAAPPTAVGPGEGEVAIVAWPGYVERGENDKSYDWVTGFEKETGCKVSVKTAGTSDEMVALMNEGGFDLVTASGDASLRLVAGKKVQEVNTDLIPSWKTVDPRLQNAPWHTVGGKHYGVPYQWGSNVLMYNTKTFPDPAQVLGRRLHPQTLPDGKPNKGRVQAFDGPIYVADAALYLMAHKPELGIKDPYELNEDQYQAALALLRQQHAIVQRYWHDANAQVDDFTNEGVVASSLLAVPGQPAGQQERADRQHPPRGGGHGLGRHDDDARRGRAPELRLQVARALAPAEAPGDLGRLVRLGAGRARRLPGQRAARPPRAARPTARRTSSSIHFWRTPVAKCASQPAGCVPYYRWVTDYIAILGGR